MAAEWKNNKRPSPALPDTCTRGKCAPGASVDMAVSDYFAGNNLFRK